MTAPPQLSPDGRWWWDGTQWVPASPAPAPAPPAAADAPSETAASGSPWSQPGTTEGQAAEGAASSAPPWAQSSTADAPGYPAGSAAPGGSAPAYGAPAYGQQGYGAPGYGQQAYPSPYGTAPSYGYPGASSGSDGKAIASLVLGLTWIFWLGSIAAIVLGHVSRSQAKRENRTPSGMALAGLILGYLGIAILAGSILIGALVGTVFKDTFEEAIVADSELLEAGDAQDSYFSRHQRYATSPEELQESGFRPDPSIGFRIHAADATSYCMSAQFFGTRLYLSEHDTDTTPDSCA